MSRGKAPREGWLEALCFGRFCKLPSSMNHKMYVLEHEVVSEVEVEMWSNTQWIAREKIRQLQG